MRNPPPLGAERDPAAEREDNPENVIGAMVWDDLLAEGYEVDGTSECWRQCTPPDLVPAAAAGEQESSSA